MSRQVRGTEEVCQNVSLPVATNRLRRAMHILGWVLGLGSLYIFFNFFFNWVTFQKSLLKADRLLLLLAVGTYLLGILVRSIRWTYMVRRHWPDLTWTHGLHIMMSSNMINFLFPVRLGELLRLVIARNTFNIPYSASTAASITEKLTLFLIMLFFLSFTTQLGYQFPDWSTRFFPFLLLLLIISVAIFFLGVKGWQTSIIIADVLLRKIGLSQEHVDRLLRNRLTYFAEETLHKCHATVYTPAQYVVVTVMGILILLLDGLSNYFLLSAFGLSLTFLQAVIASCFFNLLFLLPSPPVQVGTAEMYLVLVYSGGLKLPAAVVASSAVIWHMVTAGVIILLGTLSFYAIGLSLSNILAMSRPSCQENA